VSETRAAGVSSSPSDGLSLLGYSKDRDSDGASVKRLRGSPPSTACPHWRDPNGCRRVASWSGEQLKEVDDAVRHRKERRVSALPLQVFGTPLGHNALKPRVHDLVVGTDHVG
jgi:hypothetical protein